MANLVNKKVKLKLVGLDGNAFVLLGAFQRQARRQGWTEEEINKVLTEAESSNYQHLLRTLTEHCANGGFGGDDEDEDD